MSCRTKVMEVGKEKSNMEYRQSKMSKRPLEGIYGFSKDAEQKFFVDINYYQESIKAVEDMKEELELNEKICKQLTENYNKTKDPED